MATPKLAMIPTGYKAGKLYSVLPESGVGDFTVVRATEATRVNEAGLIETMGANVPRLDYSDGGCPILLTEPQRTNIQTYSSDLASVYIPTNITQTSNYGASPDGSLTSTRVVLANLTDSRSVETLTGALTNGVVYTFSCYYKGVEGESTYMYFLSSTGGTNVSKEIIFTGYWQRESVTFTAGSASNYTYIVDVRQGTSTATDFEVWGAQVEQASYPSSYIKTEGSAVTRNADQVYGSGDAATFNDSEGVLMAEISALKDPVDFNNWLTITGGTAANSVGIVFETTGTATARIEVGGVGQSYLSTQVDYSNLIKVAFKYKENDFAWWINGFEVATDLSGVTFPSNTLNTFQFSYGAGSNNWAGKTSQIQYFNTVLTDSELETLTSWTSFIEMAQAQNYNII
tara:strand:+ start:177 stop:1379 length:1203 start_codon:yes stop_codon:yes gene_type:complete